MVQRPGLRRGRLLDDEIVLKDKKNIRSSERPWEWQNGRGQIEMVLSCDEKRG